MLLAVDFDEDFIDIDGVTVASVLSFQSTGINSSELDALEADGFPRDDDSSFSEQILDISVTQIESIVEPDSVGDDI